MTGVRFNNDNKIYESMSAPVLNGEDKLVVVAVEVATGEIATIPVDDIKKLIKLDS